VKRARSPLSVVGGAVAFTVFGALALVASEDAGGGGAGLRAAAVACVGGIALAALLMAIRNSAAGRKNVNPWVFGAIGAAVFASVPFVDDAIDHATAVALWGFLAGFGGAMLVLGGVFGPRRAADNAE